MLLNSGGYASLEIRDPDLEVPVESLRFLGALRRC